MPSGMVRPMFAVKYRFPTGNYDICTSSDIVLYFHDRNLKRLMRQHPGSFEALRELKMFQKSMVLSSDPNAI